MTQMTDLSNYLSRAATDKAI